MSKSGKSKSHYVDSKKFGNEVKNYVKLLKKCRAENEDQPEIPLYITESIMKIINGISHRPNFSGYTYLDEMIGDSMEDCIKGLLSGGFNPEKGNPFSYFSKIVWNAFVKRILKERKEVLIHRNIVMNSFTEEFAGNEKDVTQFVNSYRDYMERTQDVADFFDERHKKIKDQQIQQREKKKREINELDENELDEVEIDLDVKTMEIEGE